MDRNYNLRDRRTIRMPTRFNGNYSEEVELKKRVMSVRSQCQVKKASIMRRIEHISELIRQRGSRTKLTMLRSRLCKVQEEAVNLHRSLTSLLQGYDEVLGPGWVEDIEFLIDDCCSDVE